MRVGKTQIGQSRLLFILFAILLIVPAAYSLTNGNDGKKTNKNAKPRKIGDSITNVRRDPKTGAKEEEQQSRVRLHRDQRRMDALHGLDVEHPARKHDEAQRNEDSASNLREPAKQRR